MEKPALDPKHPIDRLAIDSEAFSEPQQCPDPPITESGISLDQPPDPSHQELVEMPILPWLPPSRLKRRTRHLEHPTDTPERSLRENVLHSSDVLPSEGR